MQPGTICSDNVLTRPLNPKRLNDLEVFFFKENDVTYKKWVHSSQEYQLKDLLVIGEPRLMESKDLS